MLGVLGYHNGKKMRIRATLATLFIATCASIALSACGQSNSDAIAALKATEPAPVIVSSDWKPSAGLPAGWFSCWDQLNSQGKWETVVGIGGGNINNTQPCPPGTATAEEQASWTLTDWENNRLCADRMKALRMDLDYNRVRDLDCSDLGGVTR